MPQDKFLIAPASTGLETDIKPWLIPDDAYAQLDNAYVFRGRTRKRFGSRLMNSNIGIATAQLFSRVRIQVATIAANTASGTVPGATPHPIGELFSVGNDIFTVWQLGTPAAMKATGGSGTYNTTTGAFVINSVQPNGTPVYWYPARPIMGLITYETADTLNNPTYAFDTQFSYQYTPSGWALLGANPPDATNTWTGTDSQFFWGNTWRGTSDADRLLFVTNNNPADNIRYWDGSTWTRMVPAVDSNPAHTLDTALIVTTFKNHLVVFNTSEFGTRYTNRARWAKFGNPLASGAWDGTIPGGGNFLDAATMEDIVSVEFIKDRLIVFFERSTWEFAYTGNQAQPFAWYQLNTELGAEATFSVVPFDLYALGVGNVGIHSCNGVNVQRIDDKIPDSVWDIHTGSDAVRRVYGIRDYYVEQVYWTFPNRNANQYSQTYPNRILVYNYKTGSWAFNDDSITAFGYYYAASVSAVTWDSTTVTWESDITWDTGTVQPLNQEILAGNQEGFVFIVDSEAPANAPALQITNITTSSDFVLFTVVNHNLEVGDFVAIAKDDNGNIISGLTPLVGQPFPDVVKVYNVLSADTFVVISDPILHALQAPQTYTGGGLLTRVSRIDILTKQFNFYAKEDKNMMVQKVNFLVDRTDEGAITVDYLLSTSPYGSIAAAEASGCLVGNSVLETTPYALYPFEDQQDRLWHPVYMIAQGNSIQFRFYLSDSQLLDLNVAQSQFQLHAFTIYAQRTGRQQ